MASDPTMGHAMFGDESQTSQQSTGTSQLQMRPEDLAQLMAQRGKVQAGTSQFANLARQLQQQSAGAAPQLQAITAPQFSTQLDPLSQSLVAQGRQGILAQAGANQARFAQQFRGQPGVARALQAQSRARATTQQNPLLAQAAQQQTGRQLAQQQAMMQAQQAENQRRLAQAGAASRGRQEQLGFGQAQLGSQAGLLSILSQLSGQLGKRSQTTSTTGTQEKGGMFSGL